ncbi:MAG: hypothetical protein LBV27_00490, partial [Oscillospiraceae bacterium]|nr:hypothetical protein [Oscillospiraceae bacterium]
MGRTQGFGLIFLILIIIWSVFLSACAHENPPTQSTASMPPVSDEESEKSAVLSFDLSARYGRGFLSDDARALYDAYYALAMQFDTKGAVPVPFDFTEQEIETLLGYFIDDNPEFYW